MSTPVVFSPLTVALADHLADALADRGITVPVRNAVPRTGRPPRYLLVLQPGGALANRITDRPRIVIEVVDESGSAAAELAAIVRALVHAAAPGYVADIWVDKVIDIGLAYSADPDTNAPRCLVTNELWCRGTVLT
ncbi:hypothetical protein [Nocardia sp. NPDC049149]|uniref:hypothetical protein n=1 Tax=Nocardia sp. NPDC049149 TaxID=3364315 RepID=UPI0037193334